MKNEFLILGRRFEVCYVIEEPAKGDGGNYATVSCSCDGTQLRHYKYDTDFGDERVIAKASFVAICNVLNDVKACLEIDDIGG